MAGPRTGVILAAGFGSRLQDESGERLKPLTLVGGEPLLVRAVRSLGLAGCERVVIVIGHGASTVDAAFRAAYDGDVEVVFALNERYDLQNGVSVLTARPHLLGDEFIIAMADHVVGDEVMELAAAHAPAPGTATLLVDWKLGSIFDMDDATKVWSEGGRIARIGKTIPESEYNCVDCGVFVCTTALMDALDSVFVARGNVSLSEGVQALAERGAMHTLDIGDGFWQDVDTPEMLAHAERMLRRRLPAVA
ncbi:MAG: NTP transferase domain-containing protein [Myxococcales bacterium]|nr:NTP transferase domain-containing protein [Myxococcales bacterium]MCB9731541.1 NTP transferase domain-containing protein [Deltaproteobacteria bacterium]